MAWHGSSSSAKAKVGGMATKHIADAMFMEGCPGTANALEAGSCFELRLSTSASLAHC
jgi:hypothetical protein